MDTIHSISNLYMFISPILPPLLQTVSRAIPDEIQPLHKKLCITRGSTSDFELGVGDF